MNDRTFFVVPFERCGTRIGPSKALICAAPEQAKALARQLAPSVPGIAILERRTDPETGALSETLIAGVGIIPPSFPDGVDWTLRLN